MKALTVITCLVSIAAAFFSYLIWTQVGKQPQFIKEQAIQDYLAKEQDESEKFFKQKDTEIIPSATAKSYHSHFRGTPITNLTFPSSIFVDKTFIDAIHKDPTIDGLRLFFAAYNSTGTSPQGGKPFTKDEVTIILAPTKGGQIQANSLFDYGDPCKPPKICETP